MKISNAEKWATAGLTLIAVADGMFQIVTLYRHSTYFSIAYYSEFGLMCLGLLEWLIAGPIWMSRSGAGLIGWLAFVGATVAALGVFLFHFMIIAELGVQTIISLVMVGVGAVPLLALPFLRASAWFPRYTLGLQLGFDFGLLVWIAGYMIRFVLGENDIDMITVGTVMLLVGAVVIVVTYSIGQYTRAKLPEQSDAVLIKPGQVVYGSVEYGSAPQQIIYSA